MIFLRLITFFGRENMKNKTLFGVFFLSILFISAALIILLEKPTGTLQGIILNEFNQPISHASVGIDAYPINKKSYTNAKGEFSFDLVPVAKYYVNVNAKGYESKYLGDQVQVDEGQTKILPQIVLKEKLPFVNMSVWSNLKTPQEKVTLNLTGSKVSEIQFSVYKVNLSAFLNQGKSLADLQADTFDPALLGFEKVKEWNEKIPAEDVIEFELKVPAQIDGTGLFLIHSFASSTDRKKNFTQNLLINKSNLGFVIKQDEKKLLLYASHFDTSKPAANVNFSVFFRDGPDQNKDPITSDADGTIDFPIKNLTKDDLAGMLILAQEGENIAYAYVPQTSSYDDMDAEGMVESEGDAMAAESQPVKNLRYRAFLYTERPLYRPAQKVYFKGILRNENSQGQYDLVPTMEVAVNVTGPKGDILTEMKLTSNSYGSFWGEFDLDEEADLGYYSIVAQVNGKEYRRDFEVDEYRKPEFKVDIMPQQTRYFSGEKIHFEIDTQYYFGAPVQAQLEYTVYKDTFVYRLPGDEDPYADEGGDFYGGYGEVVEEGTLQSDANGHATVAVHSTKSDQDQRYILRVVAKDITERTVTREGDVLVTAGDFFFSTRRDQYLAMAKQNFPITIKTFDYEDKPVSRDYEVTVEREKWDALIHEYSYEKDKSFKGKTDATGQGKVDLVVSKGGYYRLNVEGKDDKGRKVIFYDYLWVSGSSADAEDYGLQKQITLVTDKKKYNPGEVAKILLIAPVKDASVLLTVEGTSLHGYSVEKLDGFSKQIEMPLEKGWVPNVYITASLITSKDVYEDSVELVLGSPEKILNVEIKPNAEVYAPAGEVTYQVSTKDDQGKPVPAEVSIGVVDESLYALKADTTNIQKFFWGPRPNRVATSNSFSGMYSGGIAKEDQNLLRRNFKDTAYWNPSVITDDQGQATVNFKLPDNLTTWRATVLGNTLSTQVGQQINKVIASKDLIARIASPRFFRERDRVTMKAILQNYTNQSQTLEVNLGLEGLAFANPEDNKARTITLAPKQVSSFDFTVLAQAPGKSKIQLLAKNATISDGVELRIPVLAHGIEEHQYAQGKIPPAVVGTSSQKNVALNLPAQVDTARSQLKLTLDTSFVSQLIGTLAYLIDYPYGCVEQTMSRMLPALMVADLNRAMGISDPVLEKKIDKVVKKSMKRILAFQHSDGGWGWWKQDETDPYMTAYALYGLFQAQQYGQKVDANVLQRGRRALENILPKDNKNPQTQGPQHDRQNSADTLAFIYYVDALLAGKVKIPNADAAYNSVLSQAYLALAHQAKNEIAAAQLSIANLESRAICKNNLCHFDMGDPKGYGNVEATAWALQALIRGGSANQVLKDQIVAWLLSERKGGMWRQTRETAAVLYAFTEYSRDLPGTVKGIKANASLNGSLLEKINVSSPHFVRRFTQTKFNEGDNSLGLENLLDQTLYYQTDLSFFSKQEDLGAASNGVSVKREYVRLNIKDFVNKIYEVTPLTGDIKPGDTLGVRITLQSDEDLSYLLIADPLPSGFEVIDGIRFDDKAEYFSEMDVRDELVALFSNRLQKGIHIFNYAIRPELKGEFHVMPTEVEEMYRPEVNGTSAEARLKVQ